MALSLKVSSEKALEDATRVKAITFLGRITRLKKKAIVRFKLYSEMINVLFPIMAEVPEVGLRREFQTGQNLATAVINITKPFAGAGTK